MILIAVRDNAKKDIRTFLCLFTDIAISVNSNFISLDIPVFKYLFVILRVKYTLFNLSIKQ